MRRPATIATLAILALAGCGGDDEQEAEQTIRDFVKATNERDVDKLCGDLLTKDFIERTTQATGDNARDACKQQFKTGRVKLGLGQIKKTEIDGDKATVTAEIELQGQKQDRPFALKKEDGDWRLAGSTGD
jgi:predicted lipid-binding transport protein (Tim44 family)